MYTFQILNRELSSLGHKIYTPFRNCKSKSEFCLLKINRSSYNTQRCKSIKHTHYREAPSQSDRLWICSNVRRRFCCKSHLYSSERNSWLLGSWLSQDLSTYWKEWCVLLRRIACWNDDRKIPNWIKETNKGESNNKMGKYSHDLSFCYHTFSIWCFALCSTWALQFNYQCMQCRQCSA